VYVERWDFYSRIRSELGDPALAVGAPRDDGAIVSGGDPYRANEVIGEPEALLELLRPLVQRLGATELVVNGPASGLDWRREGYESVRLFAERVLPELARW
jgi:hypothetical protein